MLPTLHLANGCLCVSVLKVLAGKIECGGQGVCTWKLQSNICSCDRHYMTREYGHIKLKWEILSYHNEITTCNFYLQK